MAAPTIAERIEEAALDGIQSATVDGQSVTGIPIRDQIEADRYVKATASTAKNHSGIKFQRIDPPKAG